MSQGYCENNVNKRIPGEPTIALMVCENQHMVQDPGLVMISTHSVEEIQESVTGYQEVVAKPITPAAEP